MTKSSQTFTDISEFDDLLSSQAEGVVVTIQHPTDPDRDLGMWMRVVGPDTDRARAAARKSIDNRLSRGKRKLDAADLEIEARKTLARRVTEWGGFALNGKELELSVDNVLLVFQKLPFVYEQVDSEANDRFSFTKEPKSSSEDT